MKWWLWVETFLIVLNRDLHLNETFRIVRFEIKIISLWDKKNIKIMLDYSLTSGIQYLDWLKQTNILTIF